MTRGAVVYDRRVARFSQQIAVKNNGQRALARPIRVALDNLSANATLVGGDGVTSTQLPAGSPYVTVLAADGTLGAGASIVATLQFSNPTQAAIRYVPRVLVLGGAFNTP